jgi:class 3 adenylate cyclase
MPEDPVLAECAVTMDEAGHWAQVFDATFRFVYVSREMRLSWEDTGPVSIFPIGFHLFGPEWTQDIVARNRGGLVTVDSLRAGFSEFGPYMLAVMPGGREELRRVVAPAFVDLIDELEAKDPPTVWSGRHVASMLAGIQVESAESWFRLDDARGQLAGFCLINMPVAGMYQLAQATHTADLAYLERLRIVRRPGRRPAAILMADLEASSPLARRLPTAQYFAFIRRFVRAADRCIVEGGGMVGRHAGDGIVAYFLAETLGSESAAAKASINAALALHDLLAEVAARSDVGRSDLSLRFGLHWGSTLYVGRILTAGRSEVTALGDEVNETARIEACATGGRALASKALIERLDVPDADTLGIDTLRLTYTQLADLDTATDKARRDAPAIPVCEITRAG